MDSPVLRALPLGLLCLYTAKLILSGAHSADAVIVLGLAGLTAVLSILENNKHRKEIQSKIEGLEKLISDASVSIEKNKKDIEDVKSFASSIKLSASVKPRF